MEFNWCVLVIILTSMYKAAGQKNLTTEGTAYQSSTYSRFGPRLALSPPASTAWSTSPDTCSHTGQGHLTAWWKILFQQLVFITKIVLYYRDSRLLHVKGFSLYITNHTGGNTLQGLSNSYLCYKDTSTNPQFVFDIDCLTVGRDVVFYNTRTVGEAFVELCYVEVHGCPLTKYGINCSMTCPSKCIDQHCFPGNGSCIYGCGSGFCLNNICSDDGTCTSGCRNGKNGKYCRKNYKNLALNRIAVQGEPHQVISSIVDGNRLPTSCAEFTESNTWIEVDIGFYGIIKAVYLHIIDTSSNEEKTYSIYCTNVSNSNEMLLFIGQLPNHDIAVEKKICRYVRILPPQRVLQICEIEVIGCKSGWYGKYCNMSCPEHCGGPCDLDTGDCIHGCADGYTGTKCEQECEYGKHGSQCLRMCSENCVASPCDHVTGSCVNGGCKPGWIGDNCTTECSFGSYGINCSELCSGCVHNLCDPVEGTCTVDDTCNPGWKVKLKCNEVCDNGTYGLNCEGNCSTCSNQACNRAYGNCVFGCIEGYYGDHCSLLVKAEETDYTPGAIGGGISALLIIVIVIVLVSVIVRRRTSRKDTDGKRKQCNIQDIQNSKLYTDLQRTSDNENQASGNTCIDTHIDQYTDLCLHSVQITNNTEPYLTGSKQNDTNVYEVVSNSNDKSQNCIYQNDI